MGFSVVIKYELAIFRISHRGTPLTSFMAGEINSRNNNQFPRNRWKFISEEMCWNEHADRARNMGGHLASITTFEENEQVTRIANGRSVWIGGMRKGSSNGSGAEHWSWFDGRPWTYTNWAPGEPNNYGGSENRIQLYGHSGLWNDVGEGWRGPAVYRIPAFMPLSLIVSGAGSTEVNGIYVFKPDEHENRHWGTIAGHYQNTQNSEIFIAFQDCGTAYQCPEWNKWMIISKIGVLYAAHTGGEIGIPPRDGGWETVDSWKNPGAPGGKHPAPVVRHGENKGARHNKPQGESFLPATSSTNGIEILEAVAGKPVRFKINNRPTSNDSWVGIYPASANDQDHGEQNKRWKWLREIDVNDASFPEQAEGDWGIRVFSDGGHTLHERKDFSVKPNRVITDQADTDSNKSRAIVAFVTGIFLFTMGLPLLIIGSISTGEDNLAMLIPGAIMFGIGGFLTVSTSFILISSWAKSYAESGKPDAPPIEVLEAIDGKPVRFRINDPPKSSSAWVGIYQFGAEDENHGEEGRRWKWLRDIDINDASFSERVGSKASIRVFSDRGYNLHNRVDFDVVPSKKKWWET